MFEFEIKLAKSSMENEEGMNHLWIRLLRHKWNDSSVKSQIQLQLPTGIYHAPNLTNLPEHENGIIELEGHTDEALIEIYTEGAIECGEVTLTIFFTSKETEISKHISLLVVKEDEMDQAEINEQVIERVKALSHPDRMTEYEITEVSRPKVMEITKNEFSHLEKEYRVDFEIEREG